VRIVELPDRDGFMAPFLHVVVSYDPFMDPYVSQSGLVRTVFAWGHPVLKVTGPGEIHENGEQRPASWMWLGLDDAIEPQDLTRHREVVAEFMIDLGMLGQDWVEAYEEFASKLGNYKIYVYQSTVTEEQRAFEQLSEHLSEHALPEWVDRIVVQVPYEEKDG
jgi:hypothetical protein